MRKRLYTRLLEGWGCRVQHAPVVQRIGRILAEDLIGVRFLSGAPKLTLSDFALRSAGANPRGAVNSDKVSFGAVIIHFARTFFEKNS